MAEGIARVLVRARDIPQLHVQSAGTHASENSPPSDGSLLVSLEQDIDLSAHRAQQLSPELVQWAHLILTMSAEHQERAQALGGEGKTHLLWSYASRGAIAHPVVDPMGSDLSVYRETFEELVQGIGDVLDRITSERSQTPQ